VEISLSLALEFTDMSDFEVNVNPVLMRKPQSSGLVAIRWSANIKVRVGFSITSGNVTDCPFAGMIGRFSPSVLARSRDQTPAAKTT
jgi:hypothetical protein